MLEAFQIRFDMPKHHGCRCRQIQVVGLVHDFEPFLIGSLGHGVAELRQPDGIDPDVLVSHGNHTRFTDPRETAVKQDELRPRVLCDQIHQQHRIGSLNSGLARVDLERQVMFGTQLT